jgi:peptide/nickel transport system substrate-binding protein
MRRPFAIILAAVAVGALVAGCASAAQKASPKKATTLRLALVGAPATIDPLRLQDASGTALAQLIYDGLVRVSPTLGAQSDLAQKWSVSGDGKIYTFHLNPHARWQDGKPVTPEDVVFSINAYRNPANGSPAAGLLAEVGSVKPEGKHAVRITLLRPDASFLLDACTLPILPSHLLSQYAPGKALLAAPALGTGAVGTGPFRLVSVSPGEYSLTANTRYFLGAPHIGKLTISIQPSAAAALSLVRAGKMDFAQVPPIDAHAVSTWPGVRLEKTYQLAFAGIVWNLQQAPWNSPVLRRALYFAINRALIVSGPLYGYAQVANGPLLPVSPAHDKALSARGFDPQRALSLLAAAGWQASGGTLRNAHGTPLSLEILAPSGAADRTAVLGLVARDLEAIGIKVSVRYEPFAVYTREFAAGNFQAAFALRGLTADPDVSTYFAPAAPENVGVYNNPAVSADLQTELSAVNQAQRLAALRGAQAAMEVDPPELFLYFPQSIYAISSQFGGFVSNPATVFYAAQNWTAVGSR